MGFGMFKAQAPIAIDFGSSAVKMLQLGSGDVPTLGAAAQLQIPESIRQDTDKLLAFLSKELPGLLRAGKFKGKRAVIAVPASQAFIQHMQVSMASGVKLDDIIKSQLQLQMGCAPNSVVVRPEEVCDIHRNGQACREIICFAMARDAIMRYVELLKRLKIDTVGVHTEIIAMVRAFDHLNRREADKNVSTMYVDLGWGGTRVAISHGRKIVFARYIPIGGRSFDQYIAKTLHCDMLSANAHRLSHDGWNTSKVSQETFKESDRIGGVLGAAMAEAQRHAALQPQQAEIAIATEERRVAQVPAELRHRIALTSGTPSSVPIDMSELLDTVTDELSMCMRYHRGLFQNRPIDRIILLGGESRQAHLCQHIVRTLRLPAQMGDPLARLRRPDGLETPGLSLNEPQPGWAVPCGLCTAKTDL